MRTQPGFARAYLGDADGLAEMERALALLVERGAGRVAFQGRYLQAFEDERFDILPGAAYAKGFLRTYADYLGLDAQQFVDEYNTRFAPAEEPQAAAPVRIRRPRRLLGPPLLIVPVALAVGLVAWGLARRDGSSKATPRRRRYGFCVGASPTSSTAPSSPTKPMTRSPRLDIGARPSRCYLSRGRVASAAKLYVNRAGPPTRRASAFIAQRAVAPR